MLYGNGPLPAAELETIENATLIEAGLNDGDSFKVQADGKELHLRLYYVDCLETTAYDNRDRIGREPPHNNIISASKTSDTVVRFGKQATEYVERVLSRPFTIHTGYACPGTRTFGHGPLLRLYRNPRRP